MGLKRLIPETRMRRSKLRRERSSASACASCSSNWCGDQRVLMARARKSSKLAGNARRPICRSWVTRLFIGLIVVTGEVIVGLQVVRSNVNVLHLGMLAEIDRQGSRGRCDLLALAEQKGHGRGPWGIAFQGFANRTAQSRGAVEIQQLEQLGSLAAGGFSAGKGEIQ